MAFKIATAHRYFWPITFQMPDPEKSGKLVQQSCELQFQAMPLNEFNRRQEELAKAPATMNFGQGDADFVVEVTVGWRGVQDDDGNDVPFTEEALRQALQFTWFRNAAVLGYQKSVAGEAARRGN